MPTSKVNFSARYPPSHPIWRMMTHGMYGVLIIGFSWGNASNFDITEIKMIGEIALAVVGVEAARKGLGV